MSASENRSIESGRGQGDSRTPRRFAELGGAAEVGKRRGLRLSPAAFDECIDDVTMPNSFHSTRPPGPPISFVRTSAKSYNVNSNGSRYHQPTSRPARGLARANARLCLLLS